MKLLLATLLVLMLAVAHANERPNAYWMAAAFAHELDAGMLDKCPLDIGQPAFCFRFPLGVDWLKMELDRLVRSFRDLEWVIPWNDKGDDFYSRMLEKTSDPTGFFAVILHPNPASMREGIAMLMELGLDD